jgi:hypothetical protein
VSRRTLVIVLVLLGLADLHQALELGKLLLGSQLHKLGRRASDRDVALAIVAVVDAALCVVTVRLVRSLRARGRARQVAESG